MESNCKLNPHQKSPTQIPLSISYGSVQIPEIEDISIMDVENVCDQSNNRDTVYIPEVDRDRRPYLGQQFDSLKDVHEYYNKYAKDAGFSVRIHSSRKSKDGEEILRKEYVCFKEGFTVKYKATEPKRRRSEVREGCGAKLAVVKSKSGKYEVSIFVEHHNHALSTPQKVHLLRSHRTMSAVQKCLSQQLDEVNISPYQQMGIFEIQAGGLENVGCVHRDLYNNRRRLRNEVKGHDANILVELFQSKQEKNPAFYFTIKSGDGDRITHCFWADANCRRAYRFYGDVIVFDTTYNTNRYSLIFAPFVGVNNHGQTILFGSAFLSDETTESFIWLLEQFKEAMPGDEPRMIITDQDPAMAKAISQVFPKVFHKLCSWHILNKFSERLTPVVYNEYFKHFQKCIWESNTPKEFETMWENVITKANLIDNEWLQGVYELRRKWVPAYVNHIFSAGMSSSQRAESNHSFFKKFVSKENTLVDFFVRFNRALSHQRHEELVADNKDMIERPVLRLPLLIEKQMAEIYTRELFNMFQDELWNCLLLMVELDREEENYCVYNVMAEKVFEVCRVKNTDYVSCICKKFESKGIPCRHILALFNKLHIQVLPEVYILKRWTKTSKLDRVMDDVGIEFNDYSDKSILYRRTKLFKLASNVIDKAIFSEEKSKVLTELLEVALEKMKSVEGSYINEGVLEKSNLVQQLHFNDPLQVRAKGCGKRLKRGKEKSKEKATFKARRCNGCGQVGQSHDKRNCPLLMKRSVEIEGLSMSSSDSYEYNTSSADN